MKMQHKHTVKIFLKAHKIFKIMITSERRKEHPKKFKIIFIFEPFSAKL